MAGEKYQKKLYSIQKWEEKIWKKENFPKKKEENKSEKKIKMFPKLKLNCLFVGYTQINLIKLDVVMYV